MNLTKTSLWASLSTIIKIASSIIINKFIAIFIGPSGLATIGQFRDFITMTLSFANGGVNNGIIKFTSDYKDDEEMMSKLIGTVVKLSVFSTFFIAVIILLFRNKISSHVFKTIEYNYILIIFSFTIGLFVMNTLFISILNGLKEVKRYVYANIISSFIGLALTTMLIWYFHLEGALLALAVNQSVIVVGTVYFLKDSKLFRWKYFLGKLDKNILKGLLGFSAMTLVASITMPAALMIVRNHIGESLSWEAAGQWEGLWRLSSMYLMVLTVSFGVYLLPTLSKLSGSRLRKEILSAWRVVVPVASAMAMVIYLLRVFIVTTLFSDEFLPMTEIFIYQLLGDVVKVTSWVLGIVLVSKAKTLVFITVQIIWSLSFVSLCFLFSNILGLIGVTIAYLLSYVGHLIFMLFYFRKTLLDYN